jgi:hypothetical protein
VLFRSSELGQAVETRVDAAELLSLQRDLEGLDLLDR